MSTTSVSLEQEPHLEFRCTRCWHSNCVPCTSCGQTVECVDCQMELTVPEATPERIARAEELIRSQGYSRPAEYQPRPDLSKLSEGQLFKQVQREMHLNTAEMDFSSAPAASAITRLLAVIADSIIDGLALAAGVGLYLGLNHFGLVSDSASLESSGPLENIEVLAALLFPLLILKIVQWNLIATRGQSLGKMLFFLRIVTMNGQVPGFISGVILRNWLRVALNTIPFFGLVDTLLILTESKRCIHDYLAGTRVVNA